MSDELAKAKVLEYIGEHIQEIEHLLINTDARAVRIGDSQGFESRESLADKLRRWTDAAQTVEMFGCAEADHGR